VLLKEADQIVFLGFGYDKTNMDRLGISTLAGDKRIIGSAVGIGVQERTAISRHCNSKIFLLPAEEECLYVVRERLIWE
jgi:hypothetical protein